MSDNPVGNICSVALLACFDVCAGFTTDYASNRAHIVSPSCMKADTDIMTLTRPLMDALRLLHRLVLVTMSVV